MVRGIEGTENIFFSKKSRKWKVFIVRNRRTKHLATGRTLIEALMMRDWCRANDWQKFIYRTQYIQHTHENSYQIYKDFKNDDGSYRREHFGCFRSLESAIRERDWLIECNWDLELACDLG